MKSVKKYWIVILITFIFCMIMKPILCFLILGSLFTYMGMAAILFIQKIKRIGIQWTGYIVEYETDSDGHKTPILEFKCMNGELIKEKPFIYASTDLSKIRTYKDLIKQPIPILYDPDDPRKFVLIEEHTFNYLVFAFFFLAGLLAIGLCITSLLGYIKIGL